MKCLALPLEIRISIAKWLVCLSLIDCGFVPQPGHNKYHHKIGANRLPVWHARIRVGVWQCSLTTYM